MINNEKMLRDDLRKATARMAKQMTIPGVKTAVFRIPAQELCRFDPDEPDVEEIGNQCLPGVFFGHGGGRNPVQMRAAV